MATVMDQNEIRNGVFAAPGFKFAVMKSHVFRQARATADFAVAVSPVNYGSNNLLINRHLLLHLPNQ
jgi:hypothetical protein